MYNALKDSQESIDEFLQQVVINPSGSLNSYGEKKSDLTDLILKHLSSFEIELRILLGEPTEKERTIGVGDVIAFDDIDIVITDVTIMKDTNGNDAIAIFYDWTNKWEEEQSAGISIVFKVYQDGVQLEHAIMWDGSVNKSVELLSKSLKKIKPGMKQTGLRTAFVATSENEIEIEVSPLISFFEKPVVIKMDYPQK